jgi:hypothetical protein
MLALFVIALFYQYAYSSLQDTFCQQLPHSEKQLYMTVSQRSPAGDNRSST